MQVTLGKCLVLLIALGAAASMILTEQGVTLQVAKSCIVLLLPLSLIWFPEEIGSFTGYVGRGGNINCETPAILVSLAGWFLLVGVPLLSHFLK